MLESFNHITKVKGELNLPGDKSISHRSIFFSAMADGKSVIKNLSDGEDVLSTIKSFSDLGCEIKKEKNEVIIRGKGFKNFNKPQKSLNCGNSGTTARLITGLLSAQNFESTLTGDESLSKRPMERVIIPLKQMGAKFESENNCLPLKVIPNNKLHPINYKLPIPSAQVKSSIILAGLHCEGITSIVEKTPSRNHTEKMLGLEVKKSKSGNTILVSKKNYPIPAEYFIPSDVSSAAFFIVLSILTKDSSLRIKNVSLNETRKGYLKILNEMGAKINFENISVSSGEVFGDVIVESSKLKNVEIPEEIIPNIIDEIPILSVVGLFAEGNFSIKSANELRKKESDRINSLCYNYKLLGLDVDELEDGFTISGKIKNKKVVFESFDDHRIAMTFGILSLLLIDGGKVNNFG
ncbi:MAG: 3-phosphoshikimate 1-carboxyvinyltransferase, partial [Ignavibacteria bacterium RBG_16_34_14]